LLVLASPSGLFQDFFFFCFSQLKVVCLVHISVLLPCLIFSEVAWICGLVSAITFGKFSAIIISSISYPPTSLFHLSVIPLYTCNNFRHCSWIFLSFS
jgi:hypothetical protein